MPTRRRSLALLVLLALLLAACGTAASPGAAATVDGTPVPRDLLATEVRALVADTMPTDAEERGRVVGEVQRQVLTLLIQAQIIAHVAADRGVELDQGRVDEVLTQQIEASGGEEAIVAALQSGNLTLPLFRDVLVPAQVHLDGVRADLEAAMVTVETRTVRHILVPTEEQARGLIDELAAGADFAALAEDHSTDTASAAMGGDLGAAPRGSYVVEFESAAWAAEPGEVVGPVETQFGFHVLEVTAESEIAAEELPPGQFDQLVNGELDRLLETAFLSARVEVGAGLGRWDVDATPTPRVVAPPVVGEGRSGPLMAELQDLAEPGDAEGE